MPSLRAPNVAVVTGAAHGIGRAVAESLAARGVTVAALDVDVGALAELARATPSCVPFVCDVADPAALAAARDALLSTRGRIDLVVNNAGVSVAGAVETLTLGQLRRAMDVNYWGVVHGCRTFLPALRETAARGAPTALCNVLSDFALFSLPTKAAYAASKHAAHAFTVALAGELSGTGVRLTAVYPGATATGLVARGEAVDRTQRDRESAFLRRGRAPERVARRIVRAIERGERRVLIGWDTRGLALVTRLAPDATDAIIRRLWRRIPFL